MSSVDGLALRPNAWEWQCGMCTLINHPSHESCEMCGFPRGTCSTAESGKASAEAEPRGCSAPSPPRPTAWDHASPKTPPSPQSPGQQILASIQQKADSPSQQLLRGLVMTPCTAANASSESSARADAGHEILAALRSGGSQMRVGGQRQANNPSQVLLASLKSGPDSSQQLLAALKNNGGGYVPTPARACREVSSTAAEGHTESGWQGKGRRKRGVRGNSGGGNRPMYSQAM